MKIYNVFEGLNYVFIFRREEGEKLMKDMKKRFSATINKSIEDGNDLALTFVSILNKNCNFLKLKKLGIKN